MTNNYEWTLSAELTTADNYTIGFDELGEYDTKESALGSMYAMIEQGAYYHEYDVFNRVTGWEGQYNSKGEPLFVDDDDDE